MRYAQSVARRRLPSWIIERSISSRVPVVIKQANEEAAQGQGEGFGLVERLEGEFKHSGVRVHGYIFRRLEDPTTEWVREVNRKGRELDEMASAVHPSAHYLDPDIRAGIEEWKDLAGRGPEATQLTLPF
jgi:hypothetical protein